MQSPRLVKSVVAIVLSLVFAASLAGYAAAQDYSFKVHNGTEITIKKIMISEDKKEWEEFNIGSAIAPGDTSSLLQLLQTDFGRAMWGNSTNSGHCKQYVKAVYADGSESDLIRFDLCKKGFVIEFSK